MLNIKLSKGINEKLKIENHLNNNTVITILDNVIKVNNIELTLLDKKEKSINMKYDKDSYSLLITLSDKFVMRFPCGENDTLNIHRDVLNTIMVDIVSEEKEKELERDEIEIQVKRLYAKYYELKIYLNKSINERLLLVQETTDLQSLIYKLKEYTDIIEDHKENLYLDLKKYYIYYKGQLSILDSPISKNIVLKDVLSNQSMIVNILDLLKDFKIIPKETPIIYESEIIDSKYNKLEKYTKDFINTPFYKINEITNRFSEILDNGVESHLKCLIKDLKRMYLDTVDQITDDIYLCNLLDQYNCVICTHHGKCYKLNKSDIQQVMAIFNATLNSI